MVNVHVWIGGTLYQQGSARFSDRPADAPILHFDGPMVFELADPQTRLPAGGAGGELVVRLSTPGFGKDAATTLRNFTGLPTDVHPIAQIEFPRRAGPPLQRTILLDHRC